MRDKIVEIVIIPYGSYPCELEEFTINGKKADKDDFGEKRRRMHH